VAERAKYETLFASLQQLMVAKAKVLRGGKLMEIDASELVLGDVIYLEEGDSVPADLRILDEKELASNDFALTGESQPSRKFVHAINGDVPLGSRHNLLFMGTTIDRPWGAAWGLWRNNPKDPNAQEPPADHYIQKIWATWDKLSAEPDEAKRNELFKQLLDVWAEELPMIGILGELPQPLIVKNGLKGVKDSFPIDDPTKDEQFINPQTFYWDDPSKHT